MKKLPDKVSAVSPLGTSIDGTKHRRHTSQLHRPKAITNYQFRVHPEVWTKARSLVEPGVTTVEIVSDTCVRVVNVR